MKHCKKCDRTLDPSCFSSHPNTRDKLYSSCKECVSEYNRTRHADPERKAKAIARSKGWAAANREKRRAIVKRHDAKSRPSVKLAAFNAYGGPVCACCGEQTIEFLTIDHVNNDGAEHRKKVSGGGIFKWLRAKKYPPGFQVLCRNCNWGKHVNGGVCPHQTKKLRCEAFTHEVT